MLVDPREALMDLRVEEVSFVNSESNSSRRPRFVNSSHYVTFFMC